MAIAAAAIQLNELAMEATTTGLREPDLIEGEAGRAGAEAWRRGDSGGR